MEIEKLNEAIHNELMKEAIRKFKSTEDFIKFNNQLYKEQGFKSYGLSVPEIERILKKFTNQFKSLSQVDRFQLSRKF